LGAPQARAGLKTTSGAPLARSKHIFDIRSTGGTVPVPMPKVLTQTQIDQFYEQGFVSPIRVISDAEALGYRSRLERFERETGGSLGGHLRRHSASMARCTTSAWIGATSRS
jgi:hypothetical protein